MERLGGTLVKNPVVQNIHVLLVIVSKTLEEDIAGTLMRSIGYLV